MSTETVQFTEMVREHYFLLELEHTERELALVNILNAEMQGRITPEQAEQARRAILGEGQ